MHESSLLRGSIWLVGIGVFSLAANVDAQEIRRYGDESEDSSGGGGGGDQQQRGPYYPGQPMPQSQQQSGQQNAPTRRVRPQSESKQNQGEEEEEFESYSIRIHEPGELPSRREQPNETEAEALNKPSEKVYQGVVPGERDSVEHLRRGQQASQSDTDPNEITWIGFQPEQDRTRIFVQTAREPVYSTRREEDGAVFVVRFEDTDIAARNFRRQIDASRFDRVVERIEATPGEDGGVAVRVSLRSPESPTVEVSGTYVYIDFPHESADDDGSDNGEEQ